MVSFDGGPASKVDDVTALPSRHKMADMCYYGNVMTTTRWWLCVTILHLQQYSHRPNLFYLSLVFAQDKVKQSLYNLRHVLRCPGGWGFQISRKSAHKVCKVASPTHRPSLPQRKIFLLFISLRGRVYTRDLARPEWLCQWKISVMPSGIQPATFRLVAHDSTNPPNKQQVFLNGIKEFYNGDAIFL